MIDIDSSILIQFVNFLVMWFLLNLLIFKPIRGVIAKRSQLMSEQMDAIEKFTNEADTKVKDYEAALDAARKAGAEERNKLKDEGTAEEAKLLLEASKGASAQVAEAKEEIAKEAAGAKTKLSSEVTEMANKAADKILGQI